MLNAKMILKGAALGSLLACAVSAQAANWYPLTLNSTKDGKTTQVKFEDQSSQAATEQLLRDLTSGKGVY